MSLSKKKEIENLSNNNNNNNNTNNTNNNNIDCSMVWTSPQTKKGRVFVETPSCPLSPTSPATLSPAPKLHPSKAVPSSRSSLAGLRLLGGGWPPFLLEAAAEDEEADRRSKTMVVAVILG